MTTPQKVVKMTTIVVGRDGRVFDLGKKQYPPKTVDGKIYVPWFGQCVPQDHAEWLQSLKPAEAKAFLKAN